MNNDNKKKRLILIDCGHGNVYCGNYQTPGKRSPVWADGSQLFEGELNRAVGLRLTEYLVKWDIPYAFIMDWNSDTTLRSRKVRANKYAKAYNCFLLSIHSNAGGGKGFEAFTWPGTTDSDFFADIIYEEFIKEFPDVRLRSDWSDGDYDKEERFYILGSKPPAVLVEAFFMDNEEEYRKYLSTSQGRDRIARAYAMAIKEIYQRL